MGRGRLEAFSDGVIAIIITIMVLELKRRDHKFRPAPLQFLAVLPDAADHRGDTLLEPGKFRDLQLPDRVVKVSPGNGPHILHDLLNRTGQEPRRAVCEYDTHQHRQGCDQEVKEEKALQAALQERVRIDELDDQAHIGCRGRIAKICEEI